MERLAKLNADYRRKTNMTQHKAQNLIQEKVDLEGQLHEKEQQINQMKDHIKEIESPHTSVRHQVCTCVYSPYLLVHYVLLLLFAFHLRRVYVLLCSYVSVVFVSDK